MEAVDKAKQPLQHQKTDMDGGNFSTVPGLGKGKAARKRPMINIDISTVKSQIGKKSVNSNSNKSQGAGLINLKAMPVVEVGNVEGASDATSKGGQIISPTAADSIPAVVLQPLKEEAPVPFGITVQHDTQSEASPSPPPRRFTEDRSVEQINNFSNDVLSKENLVTKFDQGDRGNVDYEDDYEEVDEEDEEEMPLAQLKPEVPVPLGISVAHVQHSEYGGSVDDGAAKIEDEMPDDDYEETDDDLPLADLKPEVPIPIGVTVAHVQHSEYGGSVDDGGQDDPLLQGSVSSGLELAPLKKEAPIPVGIRVGHVKHSEYGGDSVD